MESYAILIVIYMVMAGVNAVRKAGNDGKKRGVPPAAGAPGQSRPAGRRQTDKSAQRQAAPSEGLRTQGSSRERAAQGRNVSSIPAQSPRGSEQMPQSPGRPVAGQRRGQPLPGPGQLAAAKSSMTSGPSSSKTNRPVAGQAPGKGAQRLGQRSGMSKTAGQTDLAVTSKPAKASPKAGVGNGAATALKKSATLDLRHAIIWGQILGEPRSRQLGYGRIRRPH